MNTGEICNREVVVAYKKMPLTEAAELMREHHIGSIVVVVDRLSERVPVGIITDRDLAVAVLAKKVDVGTLTVRDVMSSELISVRESDSITDALRLMRKRGVRRLTVLTHSGALAGILAIDDVLDDVVAEQLSDVVQAIKRERVRETGVRR